MIIRKSSILAACNTVHSLPLGASQSQSSTSSISRRRGTRQHDVHREHRYGYATIADDAKGSPEHEEQSSNGHTWPTALSGQSCPTPYQIFDLKQNATYSKAQYYKLVKLYHPDLNGGLDKNIPGSVKMERYRLIVAAHTILSDPAKRNAYDRFGAGWEGRAEFGQKGSWGSSSTEGQPGPFTSSWSDPNDPVWNNATWEDWERWRMRRDGTYPDKTAPVYMANSYFVALIALLAMAGSTWNYNRAHDAGTYFVEQRDLVHDRSAKDLRRVRQDVSTIESRDARIEYFLRQREATLGTYDPEALREEKASRVLRDQEVCASDNVSGRDT